ncbi:MAG: tetratricopeptide repeat protein [Akkermansiaceae bacterium]|jgi:TolA-binding protein
MSSSIRFIPFQIVGAWILASATVSAQNQAGQEILYPSAAFSKLDTFEGVNLEDADKLYKNGDFNGAFAAYKAYSFEFPKSKAMPYVLLRMGRCLHKLDKRNAAIKGYQDVVDYYPDDVSYAAAALYYIGECHGQNGEEDKQTAVWARMVKDDDYVTQPNSGTALTHLGEAMQKLGKHEEAAEYQWRTAVAFLQTNHAAAAAARGSVLFHYAVRSPNHEKLKEFYVAASGFDGQGRSTDKPEEDGRYWGAVFNTILDTRIETAIREKACAYWTAKLGERFTDNDELRRLYCEANLVHEKKADLWRGRLEKQFALKPATMERLMQWCGYLRSDPKFRAEFFAKNSKGIIASLKPNEMMSMMAGLSHPHEMHEEAKVVMRAIRTDGMTDEELKRYAMLCANYQTEEEVMRHLARIKDKLFATKARFDYYFARSHRNAPFMEKALAEIPELSKSPQYSDGLTWTKATLLQNLGRHEEAIEAFRAANKQPDSTFEITNCLVALKQYPQAIQTVSELESVGGSVASSASWRVADIYRISGDKAKEVSQLRTVLRRYPKTKESAAAHDRLESYGVALVGGEAEAKK